MTEETYQGWTNRETWCAALWINNEQAFQEEAREVCTGHESTWLAAQALESYFDEIIFDPDRTGMSADMLNCALARVNWHEIAKTFCEEMAA